MSLFGLHEYRLLQDSYVIPDEAERVRCQKRKSHHQDKISDDEYERRILLLRAWEREAV